MSIIKEIRDKNAQRGDLILKAFSQNEPIGYFDKLENMSKSESVQIIEKALNDGMVDDKIIDRLIKAKYIRRTGSPGSYKYEYSEVHTAGRKTKNGGNATGNECWKMTKKEYKDSDNEQSEAYHRNGIVNALREGKPVPQEVLNDYPDLKGIKKEGGEKKDESKDKVERPTDEKIKEVHREAFDWYSSLSMNEQEVFRKQHPFFGEMGKDYFRSHKTSIEQLYIYHKGKDKSKVK